MLGAEIFHICIRSRRRGSKLSQPTIPSQVSVLKKYLASFSNLTFPSSSLIHSQQPTSSPWSSGDSSPTPSSAESPTAWPWPPRVSTERYCLDSQFEFAAISMRLRDRNFREKRDTKGRNYCKEGDIGDELGQVLIFTVH